jgi:hypothetical protein
VCGPGREHQQQLAGHRHRLVRRREQDLANLLRARRAARLARHDDFEPALDQRVAQRGDLGRLAHAFTAFDRDELSAIHRRRNSRR